MEHRASEQLKRMTDVNFTVADGEADPRGWSIVAKGQTVGKVNDLIIDTAAMKVRFLEVRPQRVDGREHIYIPIEQVEFDTTTECVIVQGALAPVYEVMGTSASGASTRMDAAADRSSTLGSVAPQDVQRLTRAEEEVRIGTRAVEAGEVRVGKHIETEHVREDVTVRRDEVTIERRPVTDTAYSGAEIRASGDEIRVPLVEEEIVVEKRPVIKEELVISKTQVQETKPVDVEIRKEEFDIDDDRTGRSRGGQ